ncbi:hypothetical protein [Sphingomonas abietis]|uniref:Uncharacterized protein n=1 Tax=Sphingomonas abietis TaxID=3012344 RepID=A0ABY7NIQ2_9SPHN|nr:hypothetical protein [Sphingomonas abietis]WBO20870.1 hypothetical protein PBT88_11670 [Sphingomonas abietis]
MYRPLLAIVLLLPVAAQAQDAPASAPTSAVAPRQMPTYQDNDAQWRGGTSETYGTADLHHHVDQTPAPPPVPQGYGYDPYGGGYGGSGNEAGSRAAPADGGKSARPYARQDQVDQGSPNDAAHRADRARTAALNRQIRSGYNNVPRASSGGSYAADHARYQAELARHAQDMARYQDRQADYAQRIADWQARTYACEQGDASACDATR